MGLKEIFIKQGGFNLIKQYWRSGALFTSIIEFLLLGKDRTALEILRLSADYKSKKYLEKKYIRSLQKFEQQYDNNLPHAQSNKIWVCWLQGLDDSPELVKVCYKSLQEYLTDRDIIFITEENMSQYVCFPKFITEKWRSGRITHTHMTDLLRLELLLKYGGTWIDATVLCTSKRELIPDYFFDSELFVYQTLKPGKDGLSAFISSWYMSACTNNKVLWLTRELCYEYWKANNSMIDYFLLHNFMCIVLEHNRDDWNKIVPRDNSAPHIMLLRLFEKYNKKMFYDIKEQTPFHKLSYKFSEEQKVEKGTYYDMLIRGKDR